MVAGEEIDFEGQFYFDHLRLEKFHSGSMPLKKIKQTDRMECVEKSMVIKPVTNQTKRRQEQEQLKCRNSLFLK